MSLPPLFHATPIRNLERIKIEGLNPQRAMSEERGVYLADEFGVCQNYAESQFGEAVSTEWVVLRVDGLDESRLVADRGGEAYLHADRIEAAGYTVETAPWPVILQFTGQVVYKGSISPASIRPHAFLRRVGNQNRWEIVG